MENYEIGGFRPPTPQGGGNFSKKSRKTHILNIKFYVTMREKYTPIFLFHFMKGKSDMKLC